LLRWFQAAGLLRSETAARLQRQWGESSASRRTLDALREFREKLRKEIVAWEGGAEIHRTTLEDLNRLMVAHPMLSRLSATGNIPSLQLWFEPRHPGDLFAPLAHGAAKLISSVDHNRVRKCGQCVLHFYDT